MEKYGSATPPDYDLSHLEDINFNVYLFKGEKDAVITSQTMRKLVDRIPYEKLKVMELEDYAHLDYVWGTNAHRDIYEPIVMILKEE